MIVEAISLIFGLFFIIAGYFFGFQLLSWIPSATIIIIGIISLIKEVQYNGYVALIESYNGKKCFRIVKSKKYFKTRKEESGYFLKIEGLHKEYHYPDNSKINLNLSGLYRELICFYKEGDKLSPINVQFDLDSVKFISESLIANHYQMMDIVKEVAKPPQDTMQTLINVGLILIMLACIITMIYNSSKLGLNVEIMNDISNRIDDILGKLSDMLIQFEGGVDRIGGVINNTNINVNIPPVTN